MLLREKVAVIYGADGPIGGAIAAAFAREGARVSSSGAPGSISTRLLRRSARVVASPLPPLSMRSMSARSMPMSKGWPRKLGDSTSRATDYERDADAVPDDQSRRAADEQTGIGGDPALRRRRAADRIRHGRFHDRLDAIESLRRQWSFELGQHGIRVVTLKTGGISETLPADSPDLRCSPPY